MVLGLVLERFERAPHGVDLGGAHRLDGAVDHLALDDPAEVVQPAQIVQIDPGGDRGALRKGDDETLGLQPADRLADRDVTHPEAPLELGDVDPLARLDLAREERATQQDGYVVDDADALDGVVTGRLHAASLARKPTRYNI